jgi:hypothetical protein
MARNRHVKKDGQERSETILFNADPGVKSIETSVALAGGESQEQSGDPAG